MGDPQERTVFTLFEDVVEHLGVPWIDPYEILACLRRAWPFGKMSHEDWLQRYNERIGAVHGRVNTLPAEKIAPWWAPECPPSEGPSVPKHPRGTGWLWRGWGIDAELRPEWIERLNALPNVIIVHTCSGHVGSLLYPSIDMMVAHPDIKAGNGDGDTVHALVGRDFGDLAQAVAFETRDCGAYFAYPNQILIALWSWVPREWMSDCEFISWWEQIISRLERWTPALPEMVRRGV